MTYRQYSKDFGGKVATGINNLSNNWWQIGVVETSGKFACGVVDTGGNFATGVIDTGGNLPPVSLTVVHLDL